MDVEDEEKPSTSEAQGDQVVSEMDLFVVRDPTQRKVLLLQYPMKRSGCLENEESDGIVKASYKKQSGKLELQIPLETHSDVYDRTRGAELGSTNQEKSSSNNKEDLMNYSTMTSTSIKGHAASSYALGFINNGKLHITPVGGVNQMRHSFKYISGKACGVSVTPGKTADQGESSQSESETEQGAQTIRVKFTKDEQNARNVKKRNRRLFGHEDDENDPWVPLIHRKAESTLKDKMSLISVSDAEVAVPQVDRKFNDSVRMIVPNDSLPEKSPVVEGAPLITDLHSLTLGEQTRELMRKGTLMEFEEILSRLSVGTKRGVEVETKIIDILTEIASLVQGCWVINSDIAFKPGEKSGSTGMDLKDMSKARDYVLYRMSHGESVTRKEVLSRFNVAPEDLLLALRQIGTVEQQRGWRFKRPPDTKFIKKHHELVKAERLKWEQKWKALNAEFPVDVKRERSKSGSKKASPSRQRRRTSSNRSTSISSDTDIIKTPLIDTVIGSPRHSVHSAEPSTSNGTAGRDKPLLSSEATDELKKLIYQLLCEKSVRSFTSLRRALALKLSEADASYQLHQTEFSDEILHEAAEKSGAKIIMSQNSDPIVVFGGRGSLPEIREVLVNFLQEKNGFRLASFKKACAEKVIEMPNDDEIRAMLQECLHRFCLNCITTALRSGNKECPTCRKKLVSKRSLRPDPNFDALIAKIYPNREEYEAMQQRAFQRLSKHTNTEAFQKSVEECLKHQAQLRKKQKINPGDYEYKKRVRKRKEENAVGEETASSQENTVSAPMEVGSVEAEGIEAERESSVEPSASEASGSVGSTIHQQEIELILRPHPDIERDSVNTSAAVRQTRFLKTTGNATVDHISKYVAMRVRLDQEEANRVEAALGGTAGFVPNSIPQSHLNSKSSTLPSNGLHSHSSQTSAGGAPLTQSNHQDKPFNESHLPLSSNRASQPLRNIESSSCL